MTTKRFWTWYNGGTVKIELTEGKPVKMSYQHATEEGYTGEYRHYTLIGGKVYLEFADFGRDCDGYHCVEGNSVWDGRTFFQAEGLFFPKFEEEKERLIVHDEWAVKSGY